MIPKHFVHGIREEGRGGFLDENVNTEKTCILIVLPTFRDGRSMMDTSCASRCFGSRMRWKGATVLTGIVSLDSELFAARLRLTCPIRSGGLSIVVRCVIERPLCVENVLSCWCDAMSYAWRRPAAVPTIRSEDVREMVMVLIGWLRSVSAS